MSDALIDVVILVDLVVRVARNMPSDLWPCLD